MKILPDCTALSKASAVEQAAENAARAKERSLIRLESEKFERERRKAAMEAYEKVSLLRRHSSEAHSALPGCLRLRYLTHIHRDLPTIRLIESCNRFRSLTTYLHLLHYGKGLWRTS